MIDRLSGATVAVIGGDRREQEICRLARCSGAVVKTYGIPWPPAGLDAVMHCESLEQALIGADLCLLPLPLPGSDGAIYAPSASAPIRLRPRHFAGMHRTGRIIAGSVNEEIIGAAARASIPIDAYGNDLEGRRERAAAIAEGALALVIGATDRTIRGARVAILGNGVLGQALANMFRKLDAETSLFARTPRLSDEQPISALWKRSAGLDVLLSTIPASVVEPELFRTLPRHALVVDLAAPPGIAAAAESAGVRTLRARGLGDRAPVTVARIQWAQILALLSQAPGSSDVSAAR